jgi:hypothetical protein
MRSDYADFGNRSLGRPIVASGKSPACFSRQSHVLGEWNPKTLNLVRFALNRGALRLGTKLRSI